MLNALEGKRANPRARPPHMTGAGLCGASRPSSTTSRRSAACRPSSPTAPTGGWASGAARRAAARSSRLAGRVKRPGWWELPMGTPMREILEEHAGGMLDGYAGARRHPRRRLDAPSCWRRDFDVRHGLRLDGEGRQPPGHRHDVRARRQDLSGGAAAQPRCTSSPRSRAAGARPAARACPGRAQLLRRHRGGPGRAGRPRRARSDIVWTNGPERPFCDHSPGAMQPLESGAASTSARTSSEHIRDGALPVPRGARHAREAGAARTDECARALADGGGDVSDLVTVHIDGVAYEVESGRNLLDVVPLAGLRPALLLLAPGHGLGGRLPAVRREAVHGRTDAARSSTRSSWPA